MLNHVRISIYLSKILHSAFKCRMINFYLFGNENMSSFINLAFCLVYVNKCEHRNLS